jgi:hypothetical protein
VKYEGFHLSSSAPFSTEGDVRFSRAGKTLASEIVMKRGILHLIILPSPSVDATNFVVTDEIVDKLLDVDCIFTQTMRYDCIDVVKIVIRAATDESGEHSVEPSASLRSWRKDQTSTPPLSMLVAAP